LRLTSPVVTSQPAFVDDAVVELEIADPSHGREESFKGRVQSDSFHSELLDWVPPSSTTLNKLLNRITREINVAPQRSLCERRPVATDEGGVEVKASSFSLLPVIFLRLKGMGDSEDVPDCLERQVVDGRHGRGGGAEVDGRC
jgi:hypothetical protein